MDALLIGIVVIMALSIVQRLIPGPCQCEKCGFHVNERRMQAEVKRKKRHQNLHDQFNIMPWGDKRCPGCRAGNESDREVD